MKRILFVSLLFVVLISACGPSEEAIAGKTAIAAMTIAAAWTPTPDSTSTPEATSTPVPPTTTPTNTSSPTPTLVPFDLSVQVTDGEGSAVEGATVKLLELDRDTQTTDASGQVSWSDLPGETATLFVRTQGYLVGEETIALERGPNEIVVALERDPLGLLPSEILEPGETLLFLEDFQDGTEEFGNLVGNWEIIDDPDEPGNKVIECRLNPQLDQSFASVGITDQVDIITEFRFRFIDLDYKDEENWMGLDYFRENYFLSFSPYWRDFSIIDISGDQWTWPLKLQMSFRSDTWYEVRLEAIGPRVNVYLNGNSMGRLHNAREDAARGEHPMGLYVGSSASVQFDDVIFKVPAP